MKFLWEDNLTASIHELSLMSGLPYATAYDFLHKMENQKLVKKRKSGRASLFSSNVSKTELRPFMKLLGSTRDKSLKSSRFDLLNLHLVGNFPELKQLKAKTPEELLVKVVLSAKKNSTLLRTLPLLVKKLGTKLDFNQLAYWASLLHVNRELGFTLELTSKLSDEKKFAFMAKKLMDNRWSNPTSFLNKESNLKGFQAKLVEKNTPDLAKKWFLKMNMGLDSFTSQYQKFTANN